MLREGASENTIGVSIIMGLLDRLKKKSSSTERSVSEDNEQVEIDENQSFDNEEDLFMDSDSEENLDEFDSIELEDSDGIELEQQIDPSKTKNKRWVIFGIIVFLLFTIIIGLGLWYYFSNRIYPRAEDLTNGFFNALNEGKYNSVHSMMDKPYREKISDDDFRQLLRASAFYFDSINKWDLREENFESFDDVSSFLPTESTNATPISTSKPATLGLPVLGATLVGSIEYLDQASGEFEIKFILRKRGKQDKLYITGFQVNSEERRKREEKASHKAVTEFLGTFSKERESVFEGFFHPKRLEMWGLDKRLKLLKLHSRLVDLGFVKHSFKPDKFKDKSNVERIYFGESQTKSGNKMDATITVFYEKGTWYVTHLDFKPQ